MARDVFCCECCYLESTAFVLYLWLFLYQGVLTPCLYCFRNCVYAFCFAFICTWIWSSANLYMLFGSLPIKNSFFLIRAILTMLYASLHLHVGLRCLPYGRHTWVWICSLWIFLRLFMMNLSKLYLWDVQNCWISRILLMNDL